MWTPARLLHLTLTSSTHGPKSDLELRSRAMLPTVRMGKILYITNNQHKMQVNFQVTFPLPSWSQERGMHKSTCRGKGCSYLLIATSTEHWPSIWPSPCSKKTTQAPVPSWKLRLGSSSQLSRSWWHWVQLNLQKRRLKQEKGHLVISHYLASDAW